MFNKGYNYVKVSDLAFRLELLQHIVDLLVRGIIKTLEKNWSKYPAKIALDIK